APSWCLSPRAPRTTPILPRAGLIDNQDPSPERRALEPGNRGLWLCGIRPCDKAKAPRAARGPILKNIDAASDHKRPNQVAQFLFSRRVRKIADKNFHGYVPLC